MTKNKPPHYGNLKARAGKLGLIITRGTTEEDARMFGHEYVLHEAGENWEDMRLFSLHGIRVMIEAEEKRRAA